MSTQILVLDDSPAIVDSIEMMMELEGLTVAKFYKGSDMLDALNTQPKPDVILMDMWLSGEDGRDICRTIRADENLKIFRCLLCPQAEDWSSLLLMQEPTILSQNLSIWEI